MIRLVMMTILILTATMPLHAQTAVNLKYGILNMRFADEHSARHYGQSFGFDVIVEDSRFLFMPGLHYQQYAIRGRNSQGRLFVDHDRFHQLNLPMSLGMWLAGDRLMKLRIYGGGHFNFLIGVDKNNQGVTIDNITAFQPGVQGGIQLMLWRITADLRYVHGFRNVIHARADSKLRGWEFLIGIAL